MFWVTFFLLWCFSPSLHSSSSSSSSSLAPRSTPRFLPHPGIPVRELPSCSRLVLLPGTPVSSPWTPALRETPANALQPSRAWTLDFPFASTSPFICLCFFFSPRGVYIFFIFIIKIAFGLNPPPVVSLLAWVCPHGSNTFEKPKQNDSVN